MTTMTAKEIELGDIVTIVGGEFDGLSGVLDNTWIDKGTVIYVVVFNESDGDFAYATAVEARQ